MRLFVTGLFVVSLAAYGLGIAWLTAQGRDALRQFGSLVRTMPAYPRANDPHVEARRQEHGDHEKARHTAETAATVALDQAHNVALFGLALLLCEGGWLLAVWAEGGWAARSPSVRRIVGTSMIAALCLPLFGFVADILAGPGGAQTLQDPRLIFQIPLVAAGGSVIGAGLGAVWSLLRGPRS